MEQKLEALKQVYIQFNYWFFDDKLPDTQIVLTGNKRSFVSEIAIGHYLINIAIETMNNTPRALCRDLVHQMTHIWQHYIDRTTTRSGYHNKHWVAKMSDIGIECTTGQLTDMIDIEQGPFEVQLPMIPREDWDTLNKKVTLPDKKTNTKVSHVCPCHEGPTIYGPDGMYVICGHCNKPFTPKRK